MQCETCTGLLWTTDSTKAVDKVEEEGRRKATVVSQQVRIFRQAPQVGVLTLRKVRRTAAMLGHPTASLGSHNTMPSSSHLLHRQWSVRRFGMRAEQANMV